VVTDRRRSASSSSRWCWLNLLLVLLVLLVLRWRWLHSMLGHRITLLLGLLLLLLCLMLVLLVLPVLVLLLLEPSVLDPPLLPLVEGLVAMLPPLFPSYARRQCEGFDKGPSSSDMRRVPHIGAKRPAP
jgi:hypothetical protein